MRPLTFILAVALSSAAAACASSRGARPQPFPVPRSSPPAPAGPPVAEVVEPPMPALPPPPPDLTGSRATDIVTAALALRGTPYRNGGTTPDGFDCSGFTQYVFAEHGLALPRDVHDQFLNGTPIEEGSVAAGDLVFFTTTAPGPTHVGIAIGAGEFVHAPSSTGVVRVERLSSSYWSKRYLGARRFGQSS